MRLPRHFLGLALLAVVGLVGVASIAGQEESAPLAEETDAPQQVSVLFATNRLREKVASPERAFGGKRGEPAFGTCEVEFKPIPGMTSLAQKVPFYIPTESSRRRIEVQVHPQAFWERLAAAAEASESGHVVLFIHGYSYDFERACHRAAEAQRVLNGRAVVLMFTWPSNGSPTDYASDAADLEWSVPFLTTVLRQLTETVGEEKVQVLAHSLGSRGIVEAMLALKAEGVSTLQMNQLVLMAPDVDATSFVDLLPDLVPLAGGITLYASSNDTPLKFSRQFNGSARLGQAGEFLTVAEGMETVDVTPAGRFQILGHEYFYYHPLVTADLVELMTTGKRAAERAIPRPRSREDVTYWEIVVEEKQ